MILDAVKLLHAGYQAKILSDDSAKLPGLLQALQESPQEERAALSSIYGRLMKEKKEATLRQETLYCQLEKTRGQRKENPGYVSKTPTRSARKHGQF